ncbi:MAG: DNA repair protein RadC [Dehalococcoidia bacterium]|jgi:DNA repair protein RadC|nr:DNA repair protein RadC [Dehalococcoidia bacterium]MDW8008304.1 DNA repair protein RadC [Chloroflexota bacterium]
MAGLEYHLRIRDLPASERPRERLRQLGAGGLSNSELLAIVLRVGSGRESAIALATRLLARWGGLAGLARASFGELCAEHGMGEAKAAQVKAALELGRRLLAASPEERPVVRSPKDVANLLLADMALLEQEHLRVVLLNTRNHVLGVPEVYKGTVNSAQVRVADVFREAVREGCPAIVVVHNHPSGDPEPSREDVEVTRQMVLAGELLGIEVLDHLVLARGGYVSLRERGLGFSA